HILGRPNNTRNTLGHEGCYKTVIENGPVGYGQLKEQLSYGRAGGCDPTCVRRISAAWAIVRSSGTRLKLLREYFCCTLIVLKKRALPFICTFRSVNSQ